jgi:hypothetical protein
MRIGRTDREEPGAQPGCAARFRGVPNDVHSASDGFYADAMRTLRDADVGFLVGGAYALARYTGVIRDTKDFDLFLRERDVVRAINAFERTGYKAALTFPHWLAKVHHSDAFIDLIFRAGNGLCPVNDDWFAGEYPAEMLGQAVQLVPPERMIWQKCYIQERERFDGADVAHLIRSCATKLEWDRLVSLFGPDWRVLYAHLVLFGFIYPAERDSVPRRIMDELGNRLANEIAAPSARDRTCCGTLLSRAQYLPDIDLWGYQDARLAARNRMTAEQIRLWTNAIDK